MNINPKWARWIKASTAKHFGDIFDGESIISLIEGENRNTGDLKEWFEIRVDGPEYRKITKTQFELYCELNVLCCFVPNGKDNAYRIHDLTGLAATGFVNEIPLRQYGPSSDPDNDGSHFGCLRLNKGRREAVKTSVFGELRPDTPLIQATVEGHYKVFLEN